MKPYSISLHNGTKFSRQHNIRGSGLASKEEHIDEHGYHKTFIDIPIKQSYNETFGLSIQDYNAKQTRSDRLIIDYLQKVREEHRRSPSKKPHSAYELIVTIGNRDHHPSIKKSESTLEKWLKKFQESNPNVVVFGAYFHADEPESAPHMHVDYYFVKRQNKRGLSLQVSQNGALNEEGYFPIKEDGKMVTPQTQFINFSREQLRETARENGLYVESQTKNAEIRNHIETSQFKKLTKLKQLDEEISKKKKEFNQIDESIYNVKSEIHNLETKKQQLKNENKHLEEIHEELDINLHEFTRLQNDNEQLKSAIKERDEEISFLKRAINTLQRAFDFVKDFMDGFSISDGNKKISLWQKFKNKFIKNQGEKEYQEFKKVRYSVTLNEKLWEHEVDYLDGTRDDKPPHFDFFER